MADQRALGAFGSGSRSRRELSIFLQKKKTSSCGRARSSKGLRLRAGSICITAPAAVRGSVGLGNIGCVAMMFSVPSLSHFQGAQLGATRRWVPCRFLIARLKRAFGQDFGPPFPSELPEALLHFAVVDAHEAERHHSPAAVQYFRPEPQ